MPTTKKNFFEKKQGLITFGGYFITALIGGLSLYHSFSVSNKTLEASKKQDSLNQVQFTYLRHKDSVNEIDNKKQRAHQDSLNSEQLKNIRLQTAISKNQLINSSEINNKQNREDEPFFNVFDFTIDSTSNRFRTLNFNIYNLGKRNAEVTRYYILKYNDLYKAFQPYYGPIKLAQNKFIQVVNVLYANSDVKPNTYYGLKIYYFDDYYKEEQSKTVYFSIYKLNPIQYYGAIPESIKEKIDTLLINAQKFYKLKI